MHFIAADGCISNAGFTLIRTAQLKRSFRCSLLFWVERHRMVYWSLLMSATSLKFSEMSVVMLVCGVALVWTAVISWRCVRYTFVMMQVHIGGRQTCLTCVGVCFCTKHVSFLCLSSVLSTSVHVFMCICWNPLIFLWKNQKIAAAKKKQNKIQPGK